MQRDDPRRGAIAPTVNELRWIVAGLSMLPAASALHGRLEALLHVETILPVPGVADCRRVLVRIAKDGHECCVEHYDAATCDRIEAAYEAAVRVPRRRTRQRVSA